MLHYAGSFFTLPHDFFQPFKFQNDSVVFKGSDFFQETQPRCSLSPGIFAGKH